MRPTNSPSLTRTATRFAIFVVTLLAVLPPMLWLTVGGLLEHSQSRSAALAVGWLLEGREANAPEATSHGSIVAALGLPSDGVRVSWKMGAHDGTLREGRVGDSPAAPAFAVVAPITRSGSNAGAVYVERSLRPLLAQVLWVALCSCSLALAGWRFGIHRIVGLLGRAENRMKSQASLDPLTGLLNREGLRRRLARALSRGEARGAQSRGPADRPGPLRLDQRDPGAGAG